MSSLPFRRRALAVSAALAALPFVACVYNSPGAVQTGTQRKSAERAEHEGVVAEAPSALTSRALKVRLHATTAHVRDTLEWQSHARTIVDGANAVLAPALGIRLEITGASAWAWDSNDLHPTLEALHTLDDGEGVDWVIGLAGGLSFTTPDFHLLGVADLVSKHLVVRSVATLGDLATVEKGYARLSADEQSALRISLQNQREVAVLLHELGHTLGAVHERAAESFMGPTYHQGPHVFDLEAQRVMRVSLARRPSTIAPRRDPALASDLLAAFDPKDADAWVAADRDEILALLRAIARPTARTGAATAAAPPMPAGKRIGGEALDDVAARLAEGDRATLRSAHEKLSASDAIGAWKSGQSLWARYPNDLGVQELRCEIAMGVGGGMDAIRKECARAQELSLTPKK